MPEDSIFVAANSVDVHGRFGPKSNEYVPINGNFYGVPYRSLVPQKIENLLIAGRCVSADSTAAGAIRVMPPCMAMGQAAGVGASLCDDTTLPKDVDTDKVREILKIQNAILK